MIASGTTVSSAFMILKIIAEFPVSTLSTLSLAKMISDEAPCSNARKKNTVNTAKMITAINLSLTIGA